MRIALDTNVLAYAEGVNGPERQAEAMSLITALPRAQVVLPLQALEELFNVLTRKYRWPVEIAKPRIAQWSDTTTTAETSVEAFHTAIDLVARHKLQIWDALVLAVAAEADCRLLLSEDMQNGFTWRGLTVVNPFVAPVSPLLAAMLRP